MSGCSCASENGNPGDGSGNTGNGNTGNGNTVNRNGGAIAAGVIVVLLVAAIATGAIFVGIFVWRRRSANRECKLACTVVVNSPYMELANVF